MPFRKRSRCFICWPSKRSHSFSLPVNVCGCDATNSMLSLKLMDIFHPCKTQAGEPSNWLDSRCSARTWNGQKDHPFTNVVKGNQARTKENPPQMKTMCRKQQATSGGPNRREFERILEWDWKLTWCRAASSGCTEQAHMGWRMQYLLWTEVEQIHSETARYTKKRSWLTGWDEEMSQRVGKLSPSPKWKKMIEIHLM